MDDFLRRQIISSRDEQQRRRVAARMVDACWPAGMADKSEPVALAWLKRWRPERVGAVLPACSCGSGRCSVCN